MDYELLLQINELLMFMQLSVSSFISARHNMAKKKNPMVFLNVSIDGDPGERMVFEVLFFLFIFFPMIYTLKLCNIQPNGTSSFVLSAFL
jgi:hypothetical protein